jgi:hypothetical protein
VPETAGALPKARAAVVRFLLGLGAVHTSSIGSRLAGSAGPQGILPAAHSVVIGVIYGLSWRSLNS